MQSVRARLRKKRGKGWAYQEIDIPTDTEMERIAVELHQKHLPAVTSCLGWKVVYHPAKPISYSTAPVNPFSGKRGREFLHKASTISCCVFGYGAEWQVCYAWRDGDNAPPVRIQERGDIATPPAKSQATFLPIAVSLVDKDVLFEGAISRTKLTAHERNPKARKACIDHYGANCVVCGFDFGKVYGEMAEGFVHVHHLTPLAGVTRQRAVDFVRDLRPVCPNCHAVLHMREPPVGIEEVQRLVKRTNSLKPAVQSGVGTGAPESSVSL